MTPKKNDGYGKEPETGNLPQQGWHRVLVNVDDVFHDDQRVMVRRFFAMRIVR